VCVNSAQYNVSLRQKWHMESCESRSAAVASAKICQSKWHGRSSAQELPYQPVVNKGRPDKMPPDGDPQDQQMIRVGLLLYLMLVTAAGPAVCCCLAVRVGDIVANEAGDAKGCCPAHAPTKKETPSKCPHPPCPCKEVGYDPNIGKMSDQTEILTDLRQQLSIGAFAPFVTPPSVSVHPEAEIPPNLAFTFLDGRGILRAIHGLRC